jgi:hypothetical protein
MPTYHIHQLLLTLIVITNILPLLIILIYTTATLLATLIPDNMNWKGNTLPPMSTWRRPPPHRKGNLTRRTHPLLSDDSTPPLLLFILCKLLCLLVVAAFGIQMPNEEEGQEQVIGPVVAKWEASAGIFRGRLYPLLPPLPRHSSIIIM